MTDSGSEMYTEERNDRLSLKCIQKKGMTDSESEMYTEERNDRLRA